MLPPTCIVVPTYWTRAGGAPRPGDAVYDHPTPLDGSSTLPPLLSSLEQLDSASFYLLLIVAVTGEDVQDAALAAVDELLRRHPRLVSLVFGASDLQWLHSWLANRALTEAEGYLALQTYPRIRNLQLALPLGLGSRAIVAIDDDEIVTDPGFLDKATMPLGTEIGGRTVDGLSGHYLQEDGGILLKVNPANVASSNIFDRKAEIMNGATLRLEEEPGDVVETPFCFGGNMEFTPELAATVGFDPDITRGEDIDYLINARMEGKTFFLRKDLNILHRPPQGGSYKDTTLSKLEQDVVRFIYETEKLSASQQVPDLCPVTAAELMPYPGEFLTGTIDGDAIAALQQAGYPGDAEAFVRGVHQKARAKILRYLDFRVRWPAITQALADDPAVGDSFLPRVHGL